MKPAAFRLSSAVVVAGLLLACNASSAGDDHLPQLHLQGSTTYMTGGIGKLEADAIKNAARDYPLELEFLLKAQPSDVYLSGVQVRIMDANDRLVLEVVSNGPFLLARLPAGKYSVSAEHNGNVDRRVVQVSSDEHRRVVFEWKA